MHNHTNAYDATDTLALILNALRELLRKTSTEKAEIKFPEDAEFLQSMLRRAWLSRKTTRKPENALSIFHYREFGNNQKSDALHFALLNLFEQRLIRRLPCGKTYILPQALADHCAQLTASDSSYTRFHLRDELQKIAVELLEELPQPEEKK